VAHDLGGHDRRAGRLRLPDVAGIADGGELQRPMRHDDLPTGDALLVGFGLSLALRPRVPAGHIQAVTGMGTRTA
jgi:hypothetical protein